MLCTMQTPVPFLRSKTATLVFFSCSLSLFAFIHYQLICNVMLQLIFNVMLQLIFNVMHHANTCALSKVEDCCFGVLFLFSLFVFIHNQLIFNVMLLCTCAISKVNDCYFGVLFLFSLSLFLWGRGQVQVQVEGGGGRGVEGGGGGRRSLPHTY